MANLKEKYIKEVRPALKQEFNLGNILEVPRIEKVVLNVGAGKAVEDKKFLDQAMTNLAIITGQQGVPTLARKSVAGFNIRKGMPIGVKVTLRGERMYNFLERLINIALPRMRDFRGLTPKFDGQGNYAIGIPDITIFPEINYEDVGQTHGFEIIIKVTTNDDKKSKRLLELLGFPFKR